MPARRATATAVAAVLVALAVALAPATAGGAPTATAAPAAAAGTACDPAVPTTCTLADLADRLGMRVGGTAEPEEIVPGPYADTLAGHFNALTVENALKWYRTQPVPGDFEFAGADAIIAFAEANDLAVRGHTLVWAQDTFTPDWVKAIADPATLRATMTTHIQTVMGRYAGRIPRWDVVNEPLASVGTTRSDSVYDRVLGPGWITEAFAIAHATDPTAELWLNEYGTDWVPGKHDALVALVADLLAAGVPLHGVGIQTHRLGPDGPDDTFRAQLAEIAALGVEVAITELDVLTDPADPDAMTRQADAYRRVVEACLAVPSCTEVTTWGVTDANTWLDRFGLWPTPTRPLLFDDAYVPKPAYHAVREAMAAAVLANEAPPTTTTTAVPPAPAAVPRYTG